MAEKVPYLKNMAEFEEALKKPKVAVDFTASWCPPCKRIGPVFVVSSWFMIHFHIAQGQFRGESNIDHGYS